jgi:hypothetical protein
VSSFKSQEQLLIFVISSAFRMPTRECQHQIWNPGQLAAAFPSHGTWPATRHIPSKDVQRMEQAHGRLPAWMDMLAATSANCWAESAKEKALAGQWLAAKEAEGSF